MPFCVVIISLRSFHAQCLQLRRLTDAVQALKRGAASVARLGSAQLAPLVTLALTSVPVDVSDVQVSYKVRILALQPLLVLC